MSYENWKDKVGTFEVMDVRGKKMDFFPALKAKAAALKNGEGLHIIQTFEPVPLYPVLALMGFEHHTEKAVSYTHLSCYLGYLLAHNIFVKSAQFTERTSTTCPPPYSSGMLLIS